MDKTWRDGTPAWYYNNDPANDGKYGKLCNQYAVNDPRGLAPEGWHIPDSREWGLLIKETGTEAGKKLKSINIWEGGIYGEGNGNNLSGFNALPGGRPL